MMKDLDRTDLDLIPNASDGLIHAVRPVPESKPEPKRRGAVATWEMEYAEICLQCPLRRCKLETNERCARFIRIRKERRKEKPK